MLQECKFKNFDGSIWVETYEDHEEENRIKIFSENKLYLTYINIKDNTKEEYETHLIDLLSKNTIDDFIQTFTSCYGITKSSYEDALYSMHIDEEVSREFNLYSEVIMDELETDLKNLNEYEICEKYVIFKIGDYYFYRGEDY